MLGIHGGGWENGDRTSYNWCFERLHAALGNVALVQGSHRPASEAPFPAAYDDCVHTLRWLHDHAHEHHLDPNRCALFGCSSGGHLTGLLATRATKEQLPLGDGRPARKERGHIPHIRAAVSFAGVLDLFALHDADTPPTYCRYYLGPPGLRDALYTLMEGPLKEKADSPDRTEAYAAASPAEHISTPPRCRCSPLLHCPNVARAGAAPRTPPMLLVHGDQDGEHDHLQRRVSLGCVLTVLTPTALRVSRGGAGQAIACHGGEAPIPGPHSRAAGGPGLAALCDERAGALPGAVVRSCRWPSLAVALASQDCAPLCRGWVCLCE